MCRNLAATTCRNLAASALWLVWGCAPAPQSPQAPPHVPEHGNLSSPGKPQPPVTIRATLPAEVAPGSDVGIAVSITPSRDCEQLTASLRGADGVRVAQSSRLSGSPKSGETLVASGTAHIDSGVAGFVVVDIDMVAGAKHYATTKAFPIQARGATRAAGSIGTPTRDANGNPIILMQSR